MYAQTSRPFESRTRATLRSAEFGFLGVCVETRMHTPRRCGHFIRSRALIFFCLIARPRRTSCWMVGISSLTRARTFTAQTHPCPPVDRGIGSGTPPRDNPVDTELCVDRYTDDGAANPPSACRSGIGGLRSEGAESYQESVSRQPTRSPSERGEESANRTWFAVAGGPGPRDS